MLSPSVSVVIPTYNSSAFLTETLASVYAQSFGPVQVVVVDDGSIDETPDLAERLIGSGSRVIRLARSGGPSRPRNVGIEAATGDLVFFFDSDDVMFPGKISRSVELMESTSDVGLLCTDFVRIAENGDRFPGRFLDDYSEFRGLPRREIGARMFAYSRSTAYGALVGANFVGTSSVVVPRSILRDIGGFDESLKNAEDHDLWLRITKRHDMGYLDEIGHGYRVRGGSMMTAPALKLAPQRIEVLRRQIAAGVSRDVLRVARRIIARNYVAMADEHRRAGANAAARRCYVRSLMERFSGRGVLGVVHSIAQSVRGVPQTPNTDGGKGDAI